MSQRHVVARGECMSSIAHDYGFLSWRTIFDHADNADLKRRRGNPNQLAPGDTVMVPDKEPAELKIATGRSHRFAVAGGTTRLRIRLRDDDGPIASKRYVLDVEGGERFESRTGPDGLIDEEI